MKDPRYKFVITVSVHILLIKGSDVLLVKNPQTSEWGPGRWGVPGGKLYEHESVDSAIERKTTQELGFGVVPESFYQIKQLIITDKQAFMIFFISHYQDQKFNGEMSDYKWFNMSGIRGTDLTEFSEFYYKDMLVSLLKDNTVVPASPVIDTLDYIKLAGDKSYQRWFSGMIKSDFDPDSDPSYIKWKTKIKE